MARDITVTFDDGSSHVYQGAPDDVTPEQVQARAEQEFGLGVVHLDGGYKSAPVAPKVAPKVAPIADTTEAAPPAGDDLSAAIMAQNPQAMTEVNKAPSVMTGRAFEKPTVDAQKNLEAMQKSGSPESVMFNAGRAKQIADKLVAKGAKKQEEIKATRQKLRDAAANEDYGFTDFLKDTGVDVSKGVVGLGESYVGLLDLTSGGAAGRVLGDMGYDPDVTNKFLTGFQSMTRKNADQNVQEATGFLDTLKAMAVNPTTLLGSIAESLPGTVMAGSAGGQFARFLAGKATKEAAALGLKGVEAEAFIKQKVLDQTTKIAAAAGAGEGLQTAGSTAEAGRQAGKDWNEYVLPALSAGLGTVAISALSGKVGQKLGIGDIETNIAARSAGVKGVGTGQGSAVSNLFKEMGKEGLLEEMPQSAQEQIFKNLATGRPWDEGVEAAAAQGLITGAAMAGGHSAAVDLLKKTSSAAQQALAPTPEAPAAQAPEQPAPTTQVPTQPAPAAQVAEQVAPPAATPDERVEQIVERLVKRGIPEADARKTAEKRVGVEAQTLATQAPINPVEALTQQFIDAGENPQVALAKATEQVKQQEQADALAQEQGAVNAGQTITEPSGAGVPVAGQPDTNIPAGGVGVTEPSGVVPAGQDVAEPAGREEGQPPTVTAEEGAPSGVETPEAVQAKAQGQEAPPAQPAAKSDNVVAEETAIPDEVANAVGDITTLPTEEEPKGTRGRKPLSPERKAASDERRKQQRKNYKQNEKTVNAAEAALNEALAPIDEEKVTSDENLAAAQEDKRIGKIQAIKSLVLLSRSFKGTKLGDRAAALLNNPAITPVELENVKKGIAAQVSKATGQVKVGRADSKFSGMTTGQQALRHIIKTGNGFQKFLAQRLLPFVKDVKFVVVEEDAPLPSQITEGGAEADWDASRGLFLRVVATGERFVFVRGASAGPSHGVNNVTVLHEMLHAALNKKMDMALDALQTGFDRKSDLAQAYKALLGTIKLTHQRAIQLAEQDQLPDFMQDLTSAGIWDDPREFVAYAMSDPDFQKFLMETEGQFKQSLLTRFVNNVRQFFNMGAMHTSALLDVVNITDTMLSKRMTPLMRAKVAEEKATAQGAQVSSQAKRTVKELDEAVADAEEKFAQSVDGAEAAKNASLLQALRDPTKFMDALRYAYDGMSYKAKEAFVYLPPTEALVSVAEKYVPELRNTDRLLEGMTGLTQQLLEDGVSVVDTIGNLSTEEKAALSKVANMATLAEYDPANPAERVRNAKLDQMFADLGEKAQGAYTTVRDYFEDMSDYFSHLLDEQIKSSGLDEEGQNRLMAKIREIYEANKKITPYFPLVRFGEFWLRVGTGADRQFFMYETLAERNAAQKELAEKFPKKNIRAGNNLRELRNSSFQSSEMLKDIFKVIDNTASMGDTETKEEMKDAVYQLFLSTMPEQSFRKQFISRQGLAGFSPDFHRVVSQAVVNMSVQLPRIKYATLLRNSISAARSSIEEQPEHEPFVSQMQERVADSLNPGKRSPIEKAVNVLNRATFVYYLSGMASALIQPTAIFQTGFGQLSKTHGFLAAGKAISSYMWVFNKFGITKTNPDGSKTYVMPTISQSNKLTPEQKRAVSSMLGRGVTQATHAMNLFTYKSTPTENLSGPKMRMAKAAVNNLVLGGMQHTAERISREIIFLASFDLNRKKMDFDEAVDQAVTDTNDALGNYASYNRPPWMKGAVGNFLFQFNFYPVHMTLYMGRNFFNMLPLLVVNKEGKAEAMRAFFGSLGGVGITAGAVGLPAFSLVMGVLGALWKAHGDELPDDMKDLDFETWWRTVYLPKTLGDKKIFGKSLSDIVERGALNALTGVDFSSRVGLNDLWLRDTKETKTVRESAMALALEKAGPSANMLLSQAEGIEAFMNGDYQKGVEKISPASIRNLVLTKKYWEEGAKDNKGAEILSRDAFTTGELLAQAVGFRSDLLANSQYATFQMIKLEQRVKNERDALLNKLDREYRKGDIQAYSKYYEERNKFNYKYAATFPEYRITDEQLANALEKRQEQRGKSWRGVEVTPKNAVVASQVLAPSRKAALERETEQRKK